MKLLAIVNPNAGKKKGTLIAEKAALMLKEKDYSLELQFSTHPGHCRELACSMNPSDWDGLIAVGGDGTLSEVINGIMENNREFKIPLGLIPVGTGNSFIQDLNIHSIEQAVNSIIENKRTNLDIGQFTCSEGQHYFINVLGNGYAADVLQEAIRFKRTEIGRAHV